MTVTVESPFKAAPTISKHGFIEILRRANSPFLTEAEIIYDAIVTHGHDPARWLAIAKHEHGFGTNKKSVIGRNNTKSWTNARSVRSPSIKDRATIITDSERKSDYVKYQSVLDSVLDGLYRVDDPTYAYAGKISIADVIKVWAPADDSNNPAGYAQAVANDVNRWANEFPYTEESTGVEMVSRPDIRTDRRSKNFGHDYAANGGRVIEAIVNHIGEGTSQSNLDYLTNGPVSCNYLIMEDGTIYELVPPQFSAWTNGDLDNPDMTNPLIAKWVNNGWNPNVRTVTIEHGGFSKRNQGGSWTPEQWESSMHLQAWLCQEYNLTPDRTHILGHFQINGVNRPYCPGLNEAEWDRLISGIRSRLAGTSPNPTPTPTPEPQPETPVAAVRYFPETQHFLAGGFKGFWESYGDKALETFGYPISEEFRDGRDIVCQWFERARFEWQPDIAQNEFDVVLGLIGAESVEQDRLLRPEAFEPKPPS